MKNDLQTTPMITTNDFQLSANHRIDSKKYTLYEVIADPRLDELPLSERFHLFNSYMEDADINQFTTNTRYALNGSNVERVVVNPVNNFTRKMINFGSNDYLNMSQHVRVVEAAIEALLQYGAGSGASCSASGRTKTKVDLEAEIADTFGYERALVYPSGFMTNVGVLSALLRSNDIAVVDMFAHASIMDGVADRNKMLFKHNDMRSLETVLRKINHQFTNKIVVVDGVYSMDGDIANLPEISALCKKYNALLMVDEAHAFGVIGKNGLGIADYFNMPADSIDILVGTLSKAIGSSGGFVTGKKELINYLRFASRPYFFTTAPFVASMAAALESIRIIKTDKDRRDRLWANVNYFKAKVTSGGFNIGQAETAIFPIILGNHNLVMDVSRLMGMNGVLTNGIPYPAVSRKQTRIRMTITAGMTPAHLDKGYEILCNSIVQSEQEAAVISSPSLLSPLSAD